MPHALGEGDNLLLGLLGRLLQRQAGPHQRYEHAGEHAVRVGVGIRQFVQGGLIGTPVLSKIIEIDDLL